jgi:tetratricopeptide (TPR) repeat protein
MTQDASATPEQCGRAMKESDASRIEKFCTYLKNSQNTAWRNSYYFLLGLAYARKSEFEAGSDDPLLRKAIDHISEAIAISASGRKSAKDADMYYMRGVLYLRNKPRGQVISNDAGKALKDFNVAISLKPNDASYYLSRGYAHNQLLNPNSAWADFQKAKALNPSDPAILDAYEKQRRISPEGLAEIRKQLDEVTRAPAGKSFTCTATIRNVLKEGGETTIVVHLKDGCGIEPISLTSSPPPECVVGAKVTATGTRITEQVLLLEAERLVDVTQISCK